MTTPGAPTGRDATRIPPDVTVELPRVGADEFPRLDTPEPSPEESGDFRTQPRPRRPRPPGERRGDRGRPPPAAASRSGRATRRAIVSGDEVAVAPFAAPAPAVEAGPDVDIAADIEPPAVLSSDAVPAAAPPIEDQPTGIQIGAQPIPPRHDVRSVPRRPTRRRGRTTAICSVLVLAATGIGALLWGVGAATVWVIAALPAATAVMIAVFAAVSASIPDA